MTEVEGTQRRPVRVFGFWTCLALVVGNMIGSGFYLLPATLAPFGWNGVFGWLVTIAGALSIAGVFGALGRAFPEAGGPYAYSRLGFGKPVGFLIAWSYWISLWVGNVAIATGVVAPLGSILPAVERHNVAATLLIVWSLAAVNCFDARAAGRVQLVTTILKFLPLAAVVVLAAAIIGAGKASAPPLHFADLALGGQTGITAAAAVTLWAFLGLESATVPAERVDNAGPVIFRATLIGTGLTGLLYLFASSAVALLLPLDQVAHSGAPLADFVRPYWGEWTASIVALAAAVTAFGALNGWILLQGEMPWAMAKDGVFPSWLAAVSSRGTPVRAHLVSAILLSTLLLLNASKNMAELFKFLILLATLASLLPYLVCSLAALRLQMDGRMTRIGWLTPVALLAVLYSAWAIWGTGLQSIGWGLLLLALGVPVYAWVNATRDQAENTGS